MEPICRYCRGYWYPSRRSTYFNSNRGRGVRDVWIIDTNNLKEFCSFCYVRQAESNQKWSAVGQSIGRGDSNTLWPNYHQIAWRYFQVSQNIRWILHQVSFALHYFLFFVQYLISCEFHILDIWICRTRKLFICTMQRALPSCARIIYVISAAESNLKPKINTVRSLNTFGNYTKLYNVMISNWIFYYIRLQYRMITPWSAFNFVVFCQVRYSSLSGRVAIYGDSSVSLLVPRWGLLLFQTILRDVGLANWSGCRIRNIRAMRREECTQLQYSTPFRDMLRHDQWLDCSTMAWVWNIILSHDGNQ